MTKSEAAAAFGGVAELAKAIGITPQAVYQWPDVLPPRLADRVIAAATREGKPVPGVAA